MSYSHSWNVDYKLNVEKYRINVEKRRIIVERRCKYTQERIFRV